MRRLTLPYPTSRAGEGNLPRLGSGHGDMFPLTRQRATKCNKKILKPETTQIRSPECAFMRNDQGMLRSPKL